MRTAIAANKPKLGVVDPAASKVASGITEVVWISDISAYDDLQANSTPFDG
jgi:hypothetical protein